MHTQRWQEVRELLISVCELDPGERDAFLSEACADDLELRAEIESILIHSEQAPKFLQESAAEAFPDMFEFEQASSLVGQRVGPYELIQLVAYGGMGAVYLAARADGQFKKNVAIKLIKRRMVNESMIGRFRIERQTLATLDHPNIARLLDGGITQNGLPYFVMEYVDGKPIDRFCDEQRMPTLQRLQLFLRVMSAVQYAHRNLIVHRDLKPTNILVTVEGESKLLDFGIAKALQPGNLCESDTSTAIDRIMTPAYASPEQVRGEPITTASDVYSLGVILYELLTGHRPYKLKSRTPSEIELTICELAPEKPSTAVGRVDNVAASDGGGSSRVSLTPETVSRLRDEQPKQLRHRLVGDLDAIIMMALHKEPERRYASVEQFSEDIRRHLKGLPVNARKPTVRYRTSKFIHRNRAPVVAILGIVVALLVGFATTIWQSRIAVRAQQAAEQEARKVQQANIFLKNMLASVNPRKASGGEVTVREVLDEAARKIEDGALDAQPEAEAEIRLALSTAYRELGHYDVALKHVDVALDVLKQALGDHHPDVAKSMNAHGLILKAMGRYDEAEQWYRKALELQQALSGQDAAVAEVMNNLGVLLKKKGEWEEAESLYRRALTVRRKLPGRDRDVATTMTNLAAILKNKGGHTQAESLYREALEIFRGLDGERLRVASCLNNLALLLRETGDGDEAESLLREALAIRRETYGKEHPDVATAMHNLALVLRSQERYSEAESLYREVLTLRRKILPENHPYLAVTLNNLAELLVAQGEFEAAERHCREALDIRQKSLPEGHPSTAGALLVLGRIHLGRDDPGGAEPLLHQALNVYKNRLPDGHSRIARAESELAGCFVALERYAEAESLLLNSYKTIKDKHGENHPIVQETLKKIVTLYEAWGKPEEASPYIELLSPDSDGR
ncbi:MAG: serine/threonine-protein kinase [Phycisphaerales bacterium]|nr:serine/threonine-protein kinase [Phycisphaerales bacterium]